MSEKKKIPCRVCGKLFEPCATCQSDNSMFRWRNFACSKECAEKYISETIAYRESLKQSKNDDISLSNNDISVETVSKSNGTTKRKYNKKNSTNNVEVVNEESEQID